MTLRECQNFMCLKEKAKFLMPTILGRLTGISFQTELLIMTLLGLINSILNWSSFDWTILVEKIKSILLKSEHFGDIVKTVLCWVVIARIIIAHLYTVTYLANFYSILTRCRPKILLPWMIISGFKNFLLEFIVIIVCLLLYLEREFSSAWLAAFILCKVIYLVPAIYYWRIVNSFFVQLGEIQGRKLTRANLIANANANAQGLDIAERLRFTTTFAEVFACKQQRFMSLVNLDDSLYNSSFEIHRDRGYYKMSKSLATLITVDSQEFQDLQEDYRLQIIEDSSLTPAEKSMRILGLNRDDINDARIRRGKNLLPTTSDVEEIEEIVSTLEPMGNIEASNEHDTIDLSIANSTMAIQRYYAESNPHSSNVPPKDRVPSRGLPAGNTLSDCTCSKANEDSVGESILDSRRYRKRSLNDSFRFDDDGDSSKNIHFPQTNRLSSKKLLKSESKVADKFSSIDIPQSDLYKENGNIIDQSKESETMIPLLRASQRRLTLRFFVIPGFEKEEIRRLNSSSAYREDSKRMKVELLRVDDICVEQDKQTNDNLKTTESYADDPRRHDVRDERSIFSIDGNTPRVYAQTDRLNDPEQWSSNENLDEDKRLPNTTMASTSTQTNISDCWKTTIFQTTLDIANDRDPDFFRSKPSDRSSLSKGILLSDTPKFFRPKKRLETIEEREAREMRALRLYNRQTLFKYKREMEEKKHNLPFGNCVGLESMIFITNPVTKDTRQVSKTVQQGGFANEKGQVGLDEIAKHQSRSRTQRQTSKLSTFNLELDALEYSISLSFSCERKNRTRPQFAINNSNEIPPSSQPDEIKQLSKYRKLMRIADGPNVSSLSTTRFEEHRRGRELDGTPGVENIIDRNTIAEINRRIDNCREETSQNRLRNVRSGTNIPSSKNLGNCDSSIVESDDGPKLGDKHGISSLKETIKNIDWGFNDHRNSNENDSLSRDNFISNSENVLYDIIDDTDIISLLQSAFASNHGNIERGFYLGPGSTDLYSVSNYFNDVLQEIMKTARLGPNPDSFANEPTTEVDYGDSHLREFQVTRLLELESSDEETDSDTEASDDIKIQDFKPAGSAEFDRSDPIEICWNSDSGEGFDARNDEQRAIKEIDVANEKHEIDYIGDEKYRQSLSSNNLYANKGIADLFGEQEISYLKFWTNELKDLASHDRRKDAEFMKQFQHLTEMPGYCVVKTLLDFFRDFVSVSRSTMTSRMFLSANRVGTPNSMPSEEIISGGFNERSNISLVNDASIDPQNVAFIRVDRLTESTEGSHSRNSEVIGIHDDRTMFPLRENQFYFGTPENTRRVIKENFSRDSTSESQIQDEKLIRNEEMEAFHLANREFPQASASSTLSITEISSIIDTWLRVRNDEGLTVDSFDSFYSIGNGGTSKHSDNVISIDGGESPFEDFPEDHPNSSSCIESQPQYTPHSENQ